jgi:hypothetical protein
LGGLASAALFSPPNIILLSEMRNEPAGAIQNEGVVGLT